MNDEMNDEMNEETKGEYFFSDEDDLKLNTIDIFRSFIRYTN